MESSNQGNELDHLVMNFRRSIIIAELWQPEVARHGKVLNFAFFRKTTPYGIASPIDVLCSNFVKFADREIGNVVRYLPDKNFCLTLKFSLYCADRDQNLSGPAPENVLRVLQIPSKSVHFRGVISESVNTVKGTVGVYSIRLKPSFEPNNNKMFSCCKGSARRIVSHKDLK